MANKRKRSSGDSQHRNTRANPASTHHQFLDAGGMAQDAGIVVNGTRFPIAEVMGSQGNSLWPATTSILRNLNTRDYNNLRLSARSLFSSLPVPTVGQQDPGPVRNLGRDCQNIRTFPPSQAPRIRFPRPTVPYPGVQCPYRHLNDRTRPKILRCAGFEHGLPSAVGPDGHGRDFFVCEKCVFESEFQYCLEISLPQHSVEICAPCAGTLRNNPLPGRVCTCKTRHIPDFSTGSFWLCTACRQDHAERLYNRIMAAAQQLAPLHQAVPPGHPWQHPITMWIDQLTGGDFYPVSRNNCPCGRTRTELIISYQGSGIIVPDSRLPRTRVYQCLHCNLEVV